MFIVITILFGLVLLPFAVFFGIAVYFFIAPCYDELSSATFIEFFQKVDPYMKVWARRLLLSQIALTLLLLTLLSTRWMTLPFALTLLALLMAFTSLIIAVKGNVPINRRMDHWSPVEPPKEWEEVRDRWLRYHSLRGIAEVTGFLVLLSAALVYASRLS